MAMASSAAAVGLPFWRERKEGPINHGDRVKREFSHFGRGGLELRDGCSGYRMYWMSGWLCDDTHSQTPTQPAGRDFATKSKFHKHCRNSRHQLSQHFMTVVFPPFPSPNLFFIHTVQFHNIWGAASNIDRSSSLRPTSEIRTERLIHILSTLSLPLSLLFEERFSEIKRSPTYSVEQKKSS